MKHLSAISLFAFGLFTSALCVADDASDSRSAWAVYRGDAQATGVATSELPEKLERLWTFSLSKGGFEATAAIVGDTVYVGATDGKFYALNLSDGARRWEFSTPLGFNASPAVRDGRVYVGDIDGTFFCLDAKTGEKLWEFKADGEIDSSANFYKDYVLFGSQDAMLYCLDAKTGELAWKFEGGDQIRCFPTVVDHFAFIAGCDSTLTMIDLDNQGQVKTQIPLESPTGCSPAVMDGKVFVGTEGSTFFCVDPQKAVVWKFEAKKHAEPFRSSAAVTKDAVVVGSRDKRVHAFDPATGEELWTFAAKNRVDSSPVIVGRRVFVGSNDGRLYGLDLKTGEKVWQYELGGAVAASPAVAEGRMVIGNNHGELSCFGAK